MKYNHAEGTGQTYFQLVATGKGQCTAWADLLVAMLEAQGVSSATTVINPAAGHNAFRVEKMSAQGSAGDYPDGYPVGTFGSGFRFHQVVQIDAYPDRIYDPSYGKMTAKTDDRDVKLKYEDENITFHLVCDPITFAVLQEDADNKDVKELSW